jgi:hypothetical protein
VSSFYRLLLKEVGRNNAGKKLISPVNNFCYDAAITRQVSEVGVADGKGEGACR